MDDLIDRQAAIDAMLAEVDDVARPNIELRWWNLGLTRASVILKLLPSAQPEIIRCKDCAIRYDSCPMVVRVGGYISFFTEDEDFCSRGRRKDA